MPSSLRNLRTVVHLLNAVEWEMERLRADIKRDVRRELLRHEVQYHNVRVVPPPAYLSDEDVAYRLDQSELN